MCKEYKNKVRFRIQRIYAKDILFESPRVPKIFQVIWNPDIKLGLHNNYTKICVDVYEVVLSVTVTAMLAKTAVFICKVKQAGIFNISGLSKDRVLYCVNVSCPDILFPYARECISSKISRGAFPQCNLDPVDFDSLFTKFLKSNF